MAEISRMDEAVVDALRELGSEGTAGPSHQSQARARRAMIAAVTARRERAWFTRFLWQPVGRRSLIVELAVLMAAAIGAVGWSAPAGTPFHGVRLARETITRSLSGENRLDIDLRFAEQYLVEAAHNEDRQDSLAEARLFLDDARGQLPPGVNDRWWQRWQADENQLAALGAPPPAPVSIHTSPTPPRAPAAKPTGIGSGAGDDRDGSAEHESERSLLQPSPSASPRNPQASPTPRPDE